MKITDFFSAKAVALAESVPESNNIDYLGRVLFPFKKKMGLDLKWIKTHKNLGVTLAPSNFDAKSTLRSREGFDLVKTQMAFFRESMLVKETDEQEIMRIQESSDPYAQTVIDSVFDDAGTLVMGARTVAERMAMQLIAPADGTPKVSIEGNGVVYAYNYDPDGSFKAHNYVQMLGSSNWADTAHSTPLTDIINARDLAKGGKPTTIIMNPNTFALLKKNASIAAFIVAPYLPSDAVIKDIVATVAGVNVVVYEKMFTDDAGNDVYFYPDGVATLVPDATLGNTWFGTTPEERSSLAKQNADFALVDDAISVMVTETTDPVNTKTTVSEIVLPSFENMDKIVVMNVTPELGTLTGTVGEGSSSGTTKVTLAAAPADHSYKVSTTTATLAGIYYGTDLSAWTDYTSESNITIADATDFVIALVDENGLAVSAGVFTSDTKA